MCSVTSMLGVASSLVKNSGSPCMGCYHSRFYSAHQVPNDFTVVFDSFAVCTGVSRLDQLAYCFDMDLAVGIVLLCCSHSHVGSVLEHGLILSIELKFARFHLFSVQLKETSCSFHTLGSSEEFGSCHGLLIWMRHHC